MEEPTFEDFIRNQEKIYDKFRSLAEKIRTEGTQRDNLFQASGYVVVLIHPEWIQEKVYDFSSQHNRLVSALVQPKDTLHTTLGVNNTLELDRNTSNQLCDIVRKLNRDYTVHIEYRGWLYNPTTVIVEGYANSAFLSYANAIQRGAGNNGLKLDRPWGSHITTTRFLEEQKPENIQDFLKLMESAPVIGESKPTHIKVAYHRLTYEAYTQDTIEMFPLK